MKIIVRIHAFHLLFAFALGLLSGTTVDAAGSTDAPAQPLPNAKDHAMTQHASGTFEVKVLPLTLSDSANDETRGRMSINKIFQGGLEATTLGEMLMVGTATKGSAAYVAIERVTGKLDGRSGGFALQHTGIMNRGVPSLVITIVPDSGTGELTGISGTLTITIADGTHSYDLAYSLAEAP